MKKTPLIIYIMLLSLLTSAYSKLDYNQSRYVLQFEKKLDKCIKDIGYFTCQTLGKNTEIQQSCFNALRTFDKCLLTQCFDAEYIQFKEGDNFDYQNKYFDYSINQSGICKEDPIVVKYANKSQSTKNYIEEKKDCFDKNAIVFDPNAPLTDIKNSLDYCIKSHPKCDTKCLDLVGQFDLCIDTEEKKFVITKSFYDLKSVFPEFKKQIFSICSTNMKAQIDFSPQFSHYTHCIQKQLDSRSYSIMNNQCFGVLLVFILLINIF